MEKMITVNQKVFSNLVKFAIKANKKLDELIEMPEYNKDWLSVKEVENVFGLSRKQLEPYRKRGLKFNQRANNCTILIKKSELEKAILKNNVK